MLGTRSYATVLAMMAPVAPAEEPEPVRRIFTSQLLAALAVLGLIIGPFAAPPALAHHAAHHDMVAAMAAGDDHATMDMSAMDRSDGMPCCPEGQKNSDSDCAKSCAFMAACAGFL